MRWFPIARGRFNREVKRVFPEMTRRERNSLRRRMGQNMGRTLFEIYHNAEFHKRLNRFHVTGSGLGAIEEAQAAGKGAIIVSGHFGQWEAVRASLKARGIEVGAVYRRQSNRHYQRRLLAGIEAGGLPIMETGRVGTKTLVRHLRAGGVVAILLDEKHPDGAKLPFLGLSAKTSLAAAQLALKYDLPMVPAFGTRIGDGNDFAVEFEEPIPRGDAEAMTQAFNDSLSDRIRKDPDQWYWLLNRWRDV